MIHDHHDHHHHRHHHRHHYHCPRHNHHPLLSSPFITTLTIAYPFIRIKVLSSVTGTHAIVCRWLKQLDVISHRCVEDTCNSETGPLQSGCLVTCLRNRLQNSPIARKAKDASLIDAMTPDNPRESEALSACLRDQCQLLDYRPEVFSRCFFEKCIGADKHLYPAVMPSSRQQQHRGLEESGLMEQVSSEERNEARRREPTKEDEMEEPVSNDRRIVSLKLKRGYSDATDICIAFHCSTKPRGTWGFLKCVNENRCAGR